MMKSQEIIWKNFRHKETCSAIRDQELFRKDMLVFGIGM